MASLIHRKAWFSWTGKAKVAQPNVIGMREADALGVIGSVQNIGTRTTGLGDKSNAGRIHTTTPAAGVMNYPDTIATAYVVSTGISATLAIATEKATVNALAGFVEGEPVYLSALVATTGIAINTQYYAKDVTATTLGFSLTPGGSMILLGGSNGTAAIVRGYVGGPLA